MNNLSLRPRPRINSTNIQVITLLYDYITFPQQLTFLSDPNRSTQYVTTDRQDGFSIPPQKKH